MFRSASQLNRAARAASASSPGQVPAQVIGSPMKPDETYSFAMNAELAEQGPGDDWQVRQRTVLLADVGGNEPNQIFFPDELATMEPRYGTVYVVATTGENTFQIPAGMGYDDVWAANDRLEATQSRLAALVAALLKYAEQNDGLLPEAATWCDDLEPLIEPRAADGGEPLVTPGVDVEEGQVTFAINAELATQWPVLAVKKPALPDADKWDGIPDKLRLLIRSATGE